MLFCRVCEGRYSRSPDQLEAKSDEANDKLLVVGGQERGLEADGSDDHVLRSEEILSSSPLPGQNRRSDVALPDATPGADGQFEAGPELGSQTPGGIFDLFHVRRRRKR